jgi:hypothetical protein
VNVKSEKDMKAQGEQCKLQSAKAGKQTQIVNEK